MRRPKNLSLPLELADLRDGVEGVVQLARELRDPHAISAVDLAQRVETLLVLLRLLSDRLQALVAVGRGEADPAVLVTRANQARPATEGVVLRAWSPARRLAQVAAEVDWLKKAGRRQR